MSHVVRKLKKEKNLKEKNTPWSFGNSQSFIRVYVETLAVE